MDTKGQILLFMLFLLFVIGFIGTGLAVVWQMDADLRTLEKNGLIAFYAAQAGLEHGQLFEKNTSTTGWQPCEDDSDTACWYGTSIPGARYKFNVSSSDDVWAKGQAYNGMVLAEKHLQKNRTGSETWQER